MLRRGTRYARSKQRVGKVMASLEMKRANLEPPSSNVICFGFCCFSLDPRLKQRSRLLTILVHIAEVECRGIKRMKKGEKVESTRLLLVIDGLDLF